MKLRYRITIANVLVLMIVLYWGFTNLTSKNPNNLIGAGYLLFYSFFIFLGDLFLQWIIESYKKIMLIEGLTLAIFLSMTVIIPM